MFFVFILFPIRYSIIFNPIDDTGYARTLAPTSFPFSAVFSLSSLKWKSLPPHIPLFLTVINPPLSGQTSNETRYPLVPPSSAIDSVTVKNKINHYHYHSDLYLFPCLTFPYLSLYLLSLDHPPTLYIFIFYILYFIFSIIQPDIGHAVRVLANGPGDLGSIPGRVIPKTQMPPCLTLSIIRYGSRVKWNHPGKGVAPSPTHWCSKLSKRESSGRPRLWSPTLLTIFSISSFLPQ